MKEAIKNNMASDPLASYQWGEHCFGWVLVENPALSVKKEMMPPGSSEKLHYHVYAQQYFYILSGEADFELEGETVKIGTGNGILIDAGKKHRIKNLGNEDLNFILSSTPTTKTDRIEL